MGGRGRRPSASNVTNSRPVSTSEFGLWLFAAGAVESSSMSILLALAAELDAGAAAFSQQQCGLLRIALR